ncbi:V-type proton ATPase subunit C 1-A-like isoform X1 [Carcharodon carcharias]|uniref:V-type proton ATPase subunit C 1-A-like isoform X1 n=1 Tax=Carcharodon carcharias TaxID=13397 RepID=UPI001B7EEBA4|nr:V-type proton ATPase subunit C 1-A-like isoform X1 [Carcharodon carcharias]XP_041044846.1 V-type proton ATPase subunit C 1-A-like isoform X1 [Carcharodon carcharias]XP_041044847.1 V-type proton ATPase subunit C 1-A-like isoform X1 [Carcharodon carcharias]XP_041044848.1 V-type proton ATPase subunit C 1-A-like isoform X1 [Carcharodon carcharias]
MSEYWLISAPVDKSNQQIWERMNTVTEKASLSNNYKFLIPELKVGTLDSLVGLSDELGKLDTFVEGIVKKLAQYTADIMEDSKDKAQENLLANGVDLHRYVTHFQWDMAKYPIKQSLQNITEVIAKQISQIDTDLKSRAMTYNNTKGNLQNLERKAVGSLLTRTLADIVNKEDFVLDSEYLTTLLAFVPKSNYINWQKTYESLSDMVVPRSTKMIIEDTEGALFTVTLFKKTVDEFKIRARENKFIVREFSYSEEELHAEKEEMTRLSADKKQQYGPLLRWLKVNFSEAYIAWIHIKALRVFVESVLRYGLPVNFQAMLLQPNKKTMKRLRDVLNALFKHLDEVAAASTIDANMDIPGLNVNQQDYYAYVYFKIDIDLFNFK